MEKYWKLTEKERNIYHNMEKQIEKVFRHAHQNAYETRARYKAGVQHFAKFTIECFRKQNFNRIEPKHMQAYVEQMQEAGYSKSYIATNLSAVRYFVDLMGGDSERLPTNRELEIDPRTTEDRIGRDRSWREEEYERMREKALEQGKRDYADMMKLAKEQGLRVHEVCSVNRDMLRHALETGKLTVKGKGGLVREIHVWNREHLERLYNETPQGERTFIRQGEPTHLVINRLQNWIIQNRDTDITFHGLRHTYAQDRYRALLQQGESEYEAKRTVSRELGHFRVEVTSIYLEGR